MAAASYRKWKQGEEVDPFLSVNILVDATGFGRSAVALRYRLLRENGWLVDTDQKTFKQATYYSLAIGQPFKVATTRKSSEAKSVATQHAYEDEENTTEHSTQQVCRQTTHQYVATRHSGLLPDNTLVCRQATQEIVERVEEEIGERLDAPLEAAAVEGSPSTFGDIIWEADEAEDFNKVRADALTSLCKKEVL